jgi:hypothetical protein
MSSAPARVSPDENPELQSSNRPLWSVKIGGVEARATSL